MRGSRLILVALSIASAVSVTDRLPYFQLTHSTWRELDAWVNVRGDVMRYISLLQRVDIVVKHGVRVK